VWYIKNIKNKNKKDMKKAFYVFCTTFLGILIALILVALIDRVFVAQLLADGGAFPPQINMLGTSFFLPIIVIYLCFVLGAVTGVMMGFRWWQYVYVENGLGKRHGIFSIEKENKVAKTIKSVKKHKVTKTAKKTKTTKTRKTSTRKAVTKK
jgi:hypothetical protein